MTRAECHLENSVTILMTITLNEIMANLCVCVCVCLVCMYFNIPLLRPTMGIECYPRLINRKAQMSLSILFLKVNSGDYTNWQIKYQEMASGVRGWLKG